MIQFGEPETWKQTVDQFAENKDKTAALLDNTSLGAYYDFLDAGGQLNYEDFLQYQSIPQSDRPLTGQTPTEQLFGIKRKEVNQGGVIGPEGMFRGEDLGTREGFAELTSTQIKELKQKYPDWNDKYKFGFPKSDDRYTTIRNIARRKQKLKYAQRPEVAAARREREKTKYQTDPEYREKILAKNRRNAAKLEATLKRQKKQKEYYYTGGGREKALARLKGVAVEKNYGSWMQNPDNALFKDMVRAAEQDADLKIIRGGPQNQIVGIKEGNKIYHPVGEKRKPVPGAPKNSVSIVKHPSFKQRAEINKAINTFANTKVPGFKNLTYKKALDAMQSQIAGTPLQNKNPAEFEHTKGVAADYKKGQLALRTANRDKELILSRLEQGLITKPVAIQELKNLGVRAYVDNKFIGAPKININKQLSDYRKYVDRMIKNDPNYFSELGQGKIPTRKINFLKDVDPVAARLQKSMSSGPTLGANLGLLKGLGTALEVAGTPLAALGFAGSEYLRGRKEGKSRFEAATDPYVGLSLVAPNLISKIRPGVMRGVLGLGRAARFFTPTGIGLTLAGELKKSYDDYQRVQAMKEEDPEQYKKFMQTRVTDPLLEEEFRAIEEIGAREGAMGGGIMRLGYADGPEDPKFKSRRNFMKGVVSLLALAPFGVGKLFRQEPVQKAVTKVAEVAPQSWSWVKDNFWTVYNKIKSEGNLTKVEKKGVEVNQYKNYEVIEDPNQIRIRYETDRGNKAETVYNKPTYEVDPETGKAAKVPGEFEEFQDVYRSDGKDIYRDFEEEIIDPIEGIKDVFKKD